MSKKHTPKEFGSSLPLWDSKSYTDHQIMYRIDPVSPTRGDR